jgi:dihydroxyacid dehydratase/phosphogluconate dehydratase
VLDLEKCSSTYDGRFSGGSHGLLLGMLHQSFDGWNCISQNGDIITDGQNTINLKILTKSLHQDKVGSESKIKKVF